MVTSIAPTKLAPSSRQRLLKNPPIPRATARSNIEQPYSMIGVVVVVTTDVCLDNATPGSVLTIFVMFYTSVRVSKVIYSKNGGSRKE